MTLLSQGKPARRRSFWVDVKVDDAVYDMYTCPPNCTAEVDMIHVVNANGNTSVFVYWDIAAANVPPALQATYPTGYTSNLVGGKNMSVGEFFTLTGATLVLHVPCHPWSSLLYAQLPSFLFPSSSGMG